MKLSKGYIQVYTGNGKGKTTAALGLALRAAGAGLKVYICQFIKKGCYSELKILPKLSKNIKIEQFGRGCFIKGAPKLIDIKAAEKCILKAFQMIKSRKYDMVILDELNVALDTGLVDISAVMEMLEHKPAHVEILLTGRNAPKALIDKADLVTEMKEIKHYYKKGIKSRIGIER